MVAFLLSQLYNDVMQFVSVSICAYVQVLCVAFLQFCAYEFEHVKDAP